MGGEQDCRPGLRWVLPAGWGRHGAVPWERWHGDEAADGGGGCRWEWDVRPGRDCQDAGEADPGPGGRACAARGGRDVHAGDGVPAGGDQSRGYPGRRPRRAERVGQQPVPDGVADGGASGQGRGWHGHRHCGRVGEQAVRGHDGAADEEVWRRCRAQGRASAHLRAGQPVLQEPWDSVRRRGRVVCFLLFGGRDDHGGQGHRGGMRQRELAGRCEVRRGDGADGSQGRVGAVLHHHHGAATGRAGGDRPQLQRHPGRCYDLGCRSSLCERGNGDTGRVQLAGEGDGAHEGDRERADQARGDRRGGQRLLCDHAAC
mmetsp:Transcript_10875/g.30382  ORF Transcript_10875/g.30382 Transcript_10875/m.30382 type:complete len:316 (-) Transcript_10875:1854-2801(-)